MSDGQYVEGSYWFYAPNQGAPVFFLVAFLASGVAHAWQCYRYRCWLLSSLWWFCCLLFIVGLCFREYGAFHYDNLPIFVASICLVYAAPPLLELQNYHILGRILYYVPYCSPLHPGRVLSTFAFLSAIVEALNGWGASYSTNQSLPDNATAVGHALIKASLVIQIIIVVCFLVLASVFLLRCSRRGLVSNRRLCVPLRTLFASVAIIGARTIYRVVEYFSLASFKLGSDVDPATLSPVIRYEWYFYVFEASLMAANCIMFNVLHPRRFLPESNKTYLAHDGVTEVQGPGWRDKRPFLLTVIDPFNIGGIFKGAGAGRFWEHDNIPSVPARDGSKGENEDEGRSRGGGDRLG